MVDNDTKQRLAENFVVSKDFLVLVPLLAAGVALTFDVGYFSGIDINLFTLFTSSEHIVFALEALPLALLFVFFVAVMIFYGADEADNVTRKSTIQWITIQWIMGTVLVVGLGILYYVSGHPFLLFLMLLAGIAMV